VKKMPLCSGYEKITLAWVS